MIDSCSRLRCGYSGVILPTYLPTYQSAIYGSLPTVLAALDSKGVFQAVDWVVTRLEYIWDLNFIVPPLSIESRRSLPHAWASILRVFSRSLIRPASDTFLLSPAQTMAILNLDSRRHQTYRDHACISTHLN